MKVRFAVKIFLFITLIQAVFLSAADWPQFLGPNRNGTSVHETLVKAMLQNDVNELWRIPIGEGYSGVVVSGESLFTMDSNGKDEFIVSLRITDGMEKWRVRTGTSPRDWYGGLGPRVTPAVDAEAVVTVGAQGHLMALRTDTGALIWERNLAKDLGWRPPVEGTACSPLVSDGRIFLMIGGPNGKAVGAFDRRTGKTLWTAQNDRASYSSAIRWDLFGVRQVLFLAGANLFSLDSGTGRFLWQYPWPTYDYVNVATPLLIPPDLVFISAAYDQGAAMLRVKPHKDKWIVEEVWRNREMKNHFNNSVYFEGTIYGFDNAILKAISADTGKTLWRESGIGKGSVTLVGSYLLILSETGELMFAKAAPDQLVIEKRLPVLKGRSWTPPSITRDRILLRNQKEIICLTAASDPSESPHTNRTKKK